MKSFTDAELRHLLSLVRDTAKREQGKNPSQAYSRTIRCLEKLEALVGRRAQ